MLFSLDKHLQTVRSTTSCWMQQIKRHEGGVWTTSTIPHQSWEGHDTMLTCFLHVSCYTRVAQHNISVTCQLIQIPVITCCKAAARPSLARANGFCPRPLPHITQDAIDNFVFLGPTETVAEDIPNRLSKYLCSTSKIRARDAGGHTFAHGTALGAGLKSRRGV